MVEIRAPGGWYDYRAKYSGGMTTYLVPAPLTAPEERTCRELAERTFEALGCRGLGRVDFRMTADGRCYVLEMNTIPGFTATSLLPKAAAAAGIGFADLCDRILKLALPPRTAPAGGSGPGNDSQEVATEQCVGV